MIKCKKEGDFMYAIKNKVNELFHRNKRDKAVKMSYYHFHDNQEIYYLKKGKTKYFIGNEIYLLEPGDMIFVPKGVFHKTNSDETLNIDRLLLSFDDDFVGEEYAEYIDELKKDKFIKIPQKHMYHIADIFDRIESEQQLKNEDSKKLQQLYIRQLLILISRYRVKEEIRELGESYTIVQNAAAYISENCDGDLSLDILAKKFSMSPSHFSKQFKKITGVGLSEYINVSRISKAEKLLLKTNKPITEIASDCGYKDYAYFYKRFVKKFGTTPLKWRKQIQENPVNL